MVGKIVSKDVECVLPESMLTSSTHRVQALFSYISSQLPFSDTFLPLPINPFRYQLNQSTSSALLPSLLSTLLLKSVQNDIDLIWSGLRGL